MFRTLEVDGFENSDISNYWLARSIDRALWIILDEEVLVKETLGWQRVEITKRN